MEKMVLVAIENAALALKANDNQRGKIAGSHEKV